MKKIKLNSIQYRFWIDNLLKSDNTYNVAYSFRIEGALKTDMLKKALHMLMRTYEPFHSTIKHEMMKPFFLVDESFDLPFVLETNDECLPDTILNFIIDEQAGVPFDLETEYPCRFYLLQTPDQYVLLTLFHHIVMDGITMIEYCGRLSAIYNSLCDDKEICLPGSSALADFNRDWDENYPVEQKETDVDYWVDYLKDCPLNTPIPSQHYSNSSLRGGTTKQSASETLQNGDKVLFFALGKELFVETKNFSEQHKTTLFRLYSSVWVTILNYFLQSDDFILDHTLHVRPEKYRDLLGSFVNNLPIRVTFDDQDMSFRELLAFMRDNRREERAHQKAIYTDIISSLRSRRMLSETKELFNIGIDYPIRNHALSFDFRGCKTTFFRQTLSRMLGDICLVIEDDEQFTCSIRYKETVAESFVDMLANAFPLVLKQVMANENILLRDINFISDETKQDIIAKSEQSLHLANGNSKPALELFADISRNYPNKTSLKFNNESVTYEELDEKSNRIAGYLLTSYSGKQNIGIAMKRSADMIIAIMGIMKAGATYVPLDLENPEKRLSYIIEDCGIQAIFVDEPSDAGFGKVARLTVRSVLETNATEFSQDCFTSLAKIPPQKKSLQGEKMKQSAEFNKDSLDSAVLNHHCVNDTTIAYIIYTSGTTGVPKGIPITHGNLRNLVNNEKALFNLTGDSVVLFYANINFDASVTEIFTTLAVGATMIICNEEQQKDPTLLSLLMKHEHVTCATIPPALLAVFPHEEFPDLKTIIVGGESTTAETVKYWSRDRHFINAYGPTENTVDATMCVVTDDTPANDIGTPLPGVSCYVLDKNRRLLPDNVTGELYIGGCQLTTGYINRPEQNTESFIDNPFVSHEDKARGVNTRLYKSGDLVKRLSNGHLLFLGRSDFQVKIRGLRIELGEIENDLSAHPSVKQAFVTTQAINGENQLVAYVQTDETNRADIETLKSYMSQLVPTYMIPTYWSVLDDFPLTVNKKIDSKALPKPQQLINTGYYNAPSTVAEIVLSDIISSIIEVDKIGIDDDLFDLGLTSIQVMQAVYEASAAGIQTTVSKFYKSRTIHNILEKRRSLFCYWGNEYDKDKPLLLIVCGYPYFKPSYDEFANVMGEKYSLLVLESYNEFFLNKESCSLDHLLNAYINMLKPILKDKTLFGITGLCHGGEIGLQLACRLSNARIATPKVFVLDGFAYKSDTSYNFIEEPDVDMRVNAERNRISDLLTKSFFFNHYDGETHICLANKFSKKLRFENLPEETDPVLLSRAYERFSTNEANWKQLLPDCEIHYINSDHWSMLKTSSALEIKQVI